MINPFLHRVRSFPIKLIIDIHSYCNARCTICPYPRYSKRHSQGRMPWPLYQSIVEEFTALGREHGFRPILTYCYMGEPFLTDDLDRYVSFALDRQIDIYLNTNASVMTPQKIDALLKTGFNGKIHISFHGITPEVYQRILGLDYQTSLKHVLYLIEHYNPENILIRGVDDNWPTGEPQRWLEFWRDKHVQLEYLPPISRCGAVGRLRPKNSKKNSRNTVRLYGCQCHHPLVEMVILFDGRAVMCCQDMGRELIWGDVGKDGISTVWNSPPRKEAIELLYSGKPAPRSFLCSRCEQALGPAGLARSLGQAIWNKLTPPPKKRPAAVLIPS